jgi:hypothetical protein
VPGSSFDLVLSARDYSQSPDVDVRAWPLTVGSGQARRLDGPLLLDGITFAQLPMEALTAFTAFQIRVTESEQNHVIRFVVKLPVAGMPADRDDALLAAILSDRERVLRYILLLLMDPTDPDTLGVLAESLRHAPERRGTPSLHLPLTEELVRAAVRAPERIRQVRRLVDRLQQLPNVHELLPPGWDRVWPAIADFVTGSDDVD